VAIGNGLVLAAIPSAGAVAQFFFGSDKRDEKYGEYQ